VDQSRIKSTEDRVCELWLILGSARDLIDEIRDLSSQLDGGLAASMPVDGVLEVLGRKRDKVETLKHLAQQLRTELRVDGEGRPGVDLPGGFKSEFAQLMTRLEHLIRDEARLEQLMCGKGLNLKRRNSR
jgi:hypothetical protein